jgi:hypothetical protein
MDLDEEDVGTQRPLEARDYGIEVDFSDLSEEERDVSTVPFQTSSSFSVGNPSLADLGPSVDCLGWLGRVRS